MHCLVILGIDDAVVGPVLARVVGTGSSRSRAVVGAAPTAKGEVLLADAGGRIVASADVTLRGSPDRPQVFGRADIGNAADIVPPQVDEHDMFRPLLGVGNQLGGKGLILCVGVPSTASAGERPLLRAIRYDRLWPTGEICPG
mgnify:CR=1 FL=1